MGGSARAHLARRYFSIGDITFKFRLQKFGNPPPALTNVVGPLCDATAERCHTCLTMAAKCAKLSRFCDTSRLCAATVRDFWCLSVRHLPGP